MCVVRRNPAQAESNRSVDRMSRSIKHGLAMVLRRELGTEMDEGLGRNDSATPSGKSASIITLGRPASRRGRISVSSLGRSRSSFNSAEASSRVLAEFVGGLGFMIESIGRLAVGCEDVNPGAHV